MPSGGWGVYIIPRTDPALLPASPNIVQIDFAWI